MVRTDVVKMNWSSPIADVVITDDHVIADMAITDAVIADLAIAARSP